MTIKKRYISTVAGLVFLINLAIFSRTALYDFAFNDWGGYLDVVWRVWKGQRIYVDFTFHTGPVHIYLMLLFFKLFGFGKYAFVIHMAVISTLAAWVTFIAGRKLPIFFNCLCAFFTLAGFYWVYPHPYIDYTAHFLGLLGIAVLARTLPFQSPRMAAWAGGVCGVLATCVVMTKINIGAAYGIVYLLPLLASRHPFKSTGVFILAGLVTLALLVGTLPSPAAFYHSLTEYNGVAGGRLIRFLLIPVYLKNFFWVPFVMLPLITSGNRKIWEIALCLGVGAMAIFTINTGSYRGWDYLSMMGMYMSLSFGILLRIYSETSSQARKVTAGICMLILTSISLYQIGCLLTKPIERIRYVHNLSHTGQHILKNGPFRGWLFDKATGELLDNMIAGVQQIPASESLLVLSDMQMIYPFAGKESYKGIPAQWYAGVTPPPDKVSTVRQFLFDHRADWILTNRDDSEQTLNALMIYLGISPEYLFQNYEMVNSWGSYALFRNRKVT